uniref:Uncharacterized protein n=1 Tax=Arundo donax TaxID=35708 RepID=A0A0A9D2N6_ARUDO
MSAANCLMDSSEAAAIADAGGLRGVKLGPFLAFFLLSSPFLFCSCLLVLFLPVPTSHTTPHYGTGSST